MFFVVATYQEMFEEFQLNLPLLTLVLFWWRDIGLWLIVGIIALGVIAVAAIRLRQGRAGWLRLVATIPLFGPLWHWSGFAEWLGLLSVLVRNQIPLPEALRLAGDGVSNDHVGGISHWLADGAEEGQTVWQMLSTTRRAPSSLIPLVRWGEEKGSLPDAFCTGREMFESRVRVRSLLLQTILPPILFVAIACCAAFIVIGLFMPLNSMIQGMN
jgi:type II secretory pathway component PulF